MSLLLPLLRSTSRATGLPSRVISLTSAAHVGAPPGGVDYASLERGATPIHRWKAYSESKWGNVALAKYVDAHYGPGTKGDDAVIAVAVHPGVVATNLFMHKPTFKRLVYSLTWAYGLITNTARTGALNQIWAAELPVQQARELSGGYVWCYQRRGVERADLNDKAAVDRLWEWCEAQAAKRE